jgi:predicted DCC family thiol-disulfide oxidoreductase YuxK
MRRKRIGAILEPGERPVNDVTTIAGLRIPFFTDVTRDYSQHFFAVKFAGQFRFILQEPEWCHALRRVLDKRSAKMTATPVIVYFDGKCPLCSREVAHYSDQVKGEPVSFVDIAADNFDAVQHGLDLARARQVLHVKVGDEMLTGCDAAIAMWQAIPSYRWLSRLTRLPGIHGLADISYRIFALFLPYLQRRDGHGRVCATVACRRP